MDELIATYVNNNYSHDVQDLLYQCATLMEKFSYPDPYSSLIDIVMTPSLVTNEMISDRLIQEFHLKMDYIINQHGLTIIVDTSLRDKVRIIDVLYRVQSLEDYTPVLVTLESLEPDEIKFSTIVADLANVDITVILEVLEDISSDFLDQLKTYCYQQMDAIKVLESHNVIDPNLVLHMKVFNDLYGTQNLGFNLVTNGFQANLDIEHYLTFWDDDIEALEDRVLAIHILSLILISKNGLSNVISVYRASVAVKLANAQRVARIEALILGMMGKIEEHIKAHNLKQSLGMQND